MLRIPVHIKKLEGKGNMHCESAGKHNVGIAPKLTESHISLILHSHYNATDPLFFLLR
jgi:hypothetical protein